MASYLVLNWSKCSHSIISVKPRNDIYIDLFLSSNSGICHKCIFDILFDASFNLCICLCFDYWRV